MKKQLLTALAAMTIITPNLYAARYAGLIMCDKKWNTVSYYIPGVDARGYEGTSCAEILNLAMKYNSSVVGYTMDSAANIPYSYAIEREAFMATAAADSTTTTQPNLMAVEVAK